MCCRRDVSRAASNAAAAFVVQMPEAAGDALLQRVRVVAAGEQVEIVVAFEHQRVAAGQALLDAAGGHADVGEHAQPEIAVRHHELDGLARIVRHREGSNLEVADGERVVAVEAIDCAPSRQNGRRRR